MYTYPMNTTITEIKAVVDQLTAKGREAMVSVGKRELSYFDEGITAYSGIWGECLVSELGHKSSGVVNRLRDLGLFQTSDGDDMDSGLWWSLTELGADVANYLAGSLALQATGNEPVPSEEPRAEEPAEEPAEAALPAAKPLTKTEAYRLVKQAREGLREADEAIYKGTERQVRIALETAILNAQLLLDGLNNKGINGL